MKQQYFDYAGNSTQLPRIIIKSTIDDILKLAKLELKKKEGDLIVIDVGSGFGDYCYELAKKVKKVIGVEPFKKAYNISLRDIKKYRNLTFVNSRIEDFSTNIKFDLALSLATLEHMPNSEKAYKKVFQLLKKGGLLYLTVPNKIWPIESHYKLPFLSWLPLKIANIYLRSFRKQRSYEDSSYSKTYFGVKRLLNKMPCTYKFILPDLDAPYLGCGKPHNKLFLSFGLTLIKNFPFFWFFSKGFIVLAKKI